jgi:hypothetical protein
VKEVLGRVLTWPKPAEEEAVASLRAIEHEWVTGDEYHATLEELIAAKWPPTKKSNPRSDSLALHEN